VGFNGLCAFASVNHLHYHLYYLQHRMLLEHVVSINVLLMSCWWIELCWSHGWWECSCLKLHCFCTPVFPMTTFTCMSASP